ncbi:MAG: arginase [Limnobacter sp.]|nr:arginase [Limnobacter sp.]
MSHLRLKPVSIIGVPTDIGAGVPGARMGPEALRVAGIEKAISRYGCAVRDCGDVQGPPRSQASKPENGTPKESIRNLEQAVAWNQAVFDAVYATLKASRMPVMLGGDHCLAVGSISAVAKHCQEKGKKLRVLWLDAHADFNDSTTSPSGNPHGMPVACLNGLGPRALTHLAGFCPVMDARDIRQIGVRSVDEAEKRLLKKHHIEVFDMRYIDETGMRETMTQALAGLDANTHLHLSFDLDFLDPSLAPGVGTGVRGGPTYREAQLCMEMISDTGLLASLDIVELNPALDVRNQTAELATDLIESLFGKSTLLRMHER